MAQFAIRSLHPHDYCQSANPNRTEPCLILIVHLNIRWAMGKTRLCRLHNRAFCPLHFRNLGRFGNVIVTDDSFLTIARLLSNLVGTSEWGRIDPKLGKQLSGALQEGSGGRRGLTYGPRREEGPQSGYLLAIGEDVIPRSELKKKGGWHPNGEYR